MAVVRKFSSQPKAQPDTIRAERELNERLSAAGLAQVPMNIEAVAEFLGLEVVEEIMDNDLSGYLEERNGSWIVGVNALHHKNRRRFSIAHEIAHYVLHVGQQQQFRDTTFARRTSESNPMERDADNFAANLLMPENRVRELISSGVTTLSGLAENFGVSALAMKYRVKELGYQVNQ